MSIASFTNVANLNSKFVSKYQEESMPESMYGNKPNSDTKPEAVSQLEVRQYRVFTTPLHIIIQLAQVQATYLIVVAEGALAYRRYSGTYTAIPCEKEE